jgi:hypothetical protein
MQSQPSATDGEVNLYPTTTVAVTSNHRLVDRETSAMPCSVISIDPSDSEKLANYIGKVPWSYLAPHSLTGSLYFADPGLKLEDVGAAISANRTEQVEAWLKSADLVKIEAIHAAQWEHGDAEFEALVVSPFVLCRPA